MRRTRLIAVSNGNNIRNRAIRRVTYRKMGLSTTERVLVGFSHIFERNGLRYSLTLCESIGTNRAHVLNTKDVGHTEEFHRIFDDLLAKATNVGAFNPSIPVIQNYCE